MSATNVQVSSGLLVGGSAAMHRVRTLIRRVGPSSLPVLIQGPTGSGKELVALELHMMSGRPGPLVAMNVCAVADGMFEDALFGHVRGAFTGAQTEAPGYLFEADRGTLFLDEIGGLGVGAQAKLLRVVETKRFRPVGARSDRSSDFRIISAANERLAELVSRGRFREDLLFRLNGVLIELPALADHREDIPELARHFASRAEAPANRTPVLTNDALEVLVAHDWPGNVRELRAVIERSLVVSDGGSIGRRELSQAMGLGVGKGSPQRRRQRSDFATQRLLSVLQETDGNIGAAADLLGVHRTTVYRRLLRAGVYGSLAYADSDTVNKGGTVALRPAERRSE